MKLFGYRLSIPAVVGLAIMAVNGVAAIFAPWLAPYGETEIIGDVWAPPSFEAWLGLDNLGRDMLSRLIYGARTTISIALITTLLSFTIGCTLGFLAAVAGRWVDIFLSRIVDVLMAMPSLIFALIVLAMIDTSIPILICTIGIIDSTRVFRVSRAVAMNICAFDYIEVARLRGEGLGWIMYREVFPNSLPLLIVEFALRFGFIFLFIAALSFLGFGVQPPFADWGGMVRDNALAISFGVLAPLAPAAGIALLTVAVNLVVDWVQSVRGEGRA